MFSRHGLTQKHREQQITKNETIKYSLGMMLAFATAGLGAGELLCDCDDGVLEPVSLMC